MRRVMLSLAVLAAVAGTTFAFPVEDAKYSVKEVMKEAHGGGRNSLLAKVKGGMASDEEKAKLVELYEAMPAGKPKKGDDAAFKKWGKEMVAAAKAAQKGDTGWKEKLNKVTNCQSCHAAHK